MRTFFFYHTDLPPGLSRPGALLAVAAGFLFLATSLPAIASRATPVIVAEAKVLPFADRIEALGTLRANESVDLTATVTERVVFIGFEDGDRVKEDDILLKLSRAEEEALLEEARATANEAQVQFERAQQLAARGASSVSELDEARRIAHTARSRVQALESRLANLVVKAPFDGVVGLRNISIGALVRPGDLITTLDDDSKMLLDFSIPTTFLPVLSQGTPIVAKAAGYENTEFQGAIRSISSRIDPVTRTVVVRAEIPNEERILKPGLLMTVELRSNERETLVIPEEALMPTGDQNFVFVVEGASESAVVNRREVGIGSRRKGEVEILEGLQAGDKVVTHGTMRASDGGSVRVVAVDDGSKTVREHITTPDP